MPTNSLQPIEREALERLLRGDQPSLGALRQQLAGCSVALREFSGVGVFVTLQVSKDSPPALTSKASFRIAQVVAEVQRLEHGIGFMVLVEEGRLVELEGYTFGEPWPESIEVLSWHDVAETRNLSELE